MKIHIFCFPLIFFGFISSCHQTEFRIDPSQLPKRWTNSVGMEFVLIPPGTFDLGEGEIYPDGPVHKVTLTKYYYLARFTLTNGNYRPYRDEKKIVDPDFGIDPDFDYDYKHAHGLPKKDQLGYRYQGPGDSYILSRGPKNIIDDYALWLSKKENRTYRLPTEAELQWASRGCDKLEWNSRINENIQNNFEMRAFENKVTITGVPTNVVGIDWVAREWTNDKYKRFDSSPVIDPTGALWGSEYVVCLGINSRLPCRPQYKAFYRLLCEIDEKFVPPEPTKPIPEPPLLPIANLETMNLDLGNTVKMEFRHLPKGDVILGRPEPTEGPETKEWPETLVHIPKDFWMGTYEVTQKQFQTVTGYNPSFFKGDDHPVECLTWSEVLEFLLIINTQERKAGRLSNDEEYRLPTEAEWEYVCRAGTRTDYPFGDDPRELPWYAVFDQYDVGTSPVGSKRPNQWGFHDMLGNVMEMTCDCFAGYPGKAVTDPFERDSFRNSGYICWTSVRGGGWNFGPLASRCTWRHGMNVNSRVYHLGIRLVRGYIGPRLPMTQGWKPKYKSATAAAIVP